VIVLGPFAVTNRMSASAQMPSLLRFLAVIAILGVVVYVGLYALAHFVQPKPREISVSIPSDKFFKNR
jgi:uncharacterized membrane protein